MRNGLNFPLLRVLMLVAWEIGVVVVVVGVVEEMEDRWVEEGTKAPTAIAEDTISVHACVNFMVAIVLLLLISLI